MARKKSTVAKVAALAAEAAVKAQHKEDSRLLLNWGDGEDEENEELNAEILEDLEQIDEAAGGQVVWELYCDSPLEKSGQVRKLGRSELRGLRDECLALGPGTYHVIARGKTGSFVKDSRRQIKISGFAKPAAAVAPTTDPLTIMQQFEERAERRREQQRRDRNDQIRFWAPILAPIGLELAKGLFGNRSGDSIKDLVSALVGMKDLTGSGDKSVENLLKGIELARELAPADSKGSTWPDVIATGVTSIARELRPLAETFRKNGNGAAPPAQVPALQFAPAPASAPVVPADGKTQAEGEAMLTLVEPLLRKLAAELEEYASNATDPGLVAEALMAKVPRFIRSQVQPEQLREWLSNPQWWQTAVQFHPGLGPYQAFCDDVRLALLEMVEQLINPTDEEDGEAPPARPA